ncbi:DoxX family membrane protein [Corynebacterium uropygiale]|uniref:DoxX family membrane protein n=1 Tax=Corynebacterium uropygiale TaxID=1775911 RepID=A0A9X1QRT5_9CORY|nr:DoxX family protein [Corynebacterium uropygiale]MCF4007000.1 DoxX family membrane protein [Corynebacterium uropygiale]
MSDASNSRPDRAIDGFDDDVPTYTPKPKKETPEQTMYERTGRVAPQVIQPRRDPEPTVSFEAPTDAPREDADSASVEPEPTTALPRMGAEEEPAETPREDAVAATATTSASVEPEPTTALPREEEAPDAPAPLDLDSLPAENYTEEPVALREESDDTEAIPEYRRGTTDLGLLILRLLLALWLIMDSVHAFFGIGGGGIGSLQETFGAYALPRFLAIAVPGLEITAGVFLLFGLVTPLFAALSTVAAAFNAVHVYAQSDVGLNPFTWEAPLVLAVMIAGMSIALQFTGPGLYSLDGSRSWARRPLASSWLFVVLAVIGAAALWWFGAATNPFN